MNDAIRILGIAPYEGVKTLMETVAAKYGRVQLTTYVGDLEQGVEIAQRSLHEDYDLIISRGGTAKLIQRYVPIPVVEIEISIYDILCALRLSRPMEGKVAVVAFSNITTSASLLCDLLDYKIDIFTIQAADEVEFTLRQLQREGYQVVLCDMIANTTAKRLGLNAFLITSGLESVRDAFDGALRLYDSALQLREENRFLRDIIRGQSTQTVVLDDQGELYFSSSREVDQQILLLLCHELDSVTGDGQWRAMRSMNGMLYALSGQRLSVGAQRFTVFYIRTSKASGSGRGGIRFLTCRESEEQFYKSLYSITGAANELQETIDRLNQSLQPVLVAGEDGTGKEQVVSMLYTTSPLCNHPLVTVNCALLDEKSWDFILNHHDSPLSDAGNTIFFESVDMLPEKWQIQLLSALRDMDACRRNRIIFSCVCTQDEHMSQAGARFAETLCCSVLILPPLHARPERIPPLVNLYLSQLNVDLPRQILGVDPDALKLLRTFPWPHNYTQFKRVVNELAVTSTGQIISAEDVQRVLKREKTAASLSPKAENVAAPLDLNRTLAEIDRDVILRVLAETGDNRTATARRLGISRTTLWRLLQED